MKTNLIEIRPDRLNLPLATCAAGRLSSAVLTVAGCIPDDITALAVKIEYPADGGGVDFYTAAGTRQTCGAFRVYLAPGYFPAESEELKYHVMGTDAQGNPRWLGSGLLRVLANPADGSAVVPDILPRNLYAYNPGTGLYYKVVAETNEMGEVTLTTEQEGITL